MAGKLGMCLTLAVPRVRYQTGVGETAIVDHRGDTLDGGGPVGNPHLKMESCLKLP